MATFKYCETTVTHQNNIHEEIRSRLNSSNTCYHSVQNPLSSDLLSKNLNIKMPVVWYECETWSLTVREEHTLRLRLSENRVLRIIYGPKREEMMGGWKRLHNVELQVTRLIKSRMGWAEHVARMGEMRNAYKFFVGKAEGKRRCGRPRHRW
jgi:hypothetical protein